MTLLHRFFFTEETRDTGVCKICLIDVTGVTFEVTMELGCGGQIDKDEDR